MRPGFLGGLRLHAPHEVQDATGPAPLQGPGLEPQETLSTDRADKPQASADDVITQRSPLPYYYKLVNTSAVQNLFFFCAFRRLFFLCFFRFQFHRTTVCAPATKKEYRECGNIVREYVCRRNKNKREVTFPRVSMP